MNDPKSLAAQIDFLENLQHVDVLKSSIIRRKFNLSRRR